MYPFEHCPFFCVLTIVASSLHSLWCGADQSIWYCSNSIDSSLRWPMENFSIISHCFWGSVQKVRPFLEEKWKGSVFPWQTAKLALRPGSNELWVTSLKFPIACSLRWTMKSWHKADRHALLRELLSQNYIHTRTLF